MSKRYPLLLPALGMFVLLASAYSFSVGLPASRSAAITGDEPFYLATTQSLIDDRNFDLREQYERESYRSFFDHPDGLWRQSRAEAGERLVSPHEPGFSVILIPGFAVAGVLGAQIEVLLLAAATFALAFVLAAKESGRTRMPWLLTAAVGLSAPAFVYSTEIYPEVPAAFVLVLALFALRARPGIGRSLAVAAALSALAWFGLKYVPIAGVVAIAFAAQSGRRERVWFGSALALSGAAFVWGHFALFGSLTPYAGNSVYQGASTASVVDSHFGFTERAYRLWGLFVDRRFGIGHWAPLTLLVLPALPLLARTRFGSLVAALIGTQVLVATFLAVTMMGWWFPGRQLVVVFPLFPIALGALVAALPSRLAPAWWALGGWTLAITAAVATAGHRGAVRVAVDQFGLESPVFRFVSGIFPDYRQWSAETQLLNLAWVLTLGGTILLTTWLAFGSRVMNLLRARRMGLRAVRPSPSHSPAEGGANG